MSDWQPIETAPKDGTKVVLLIPGLGEHLGRWMDSERRENGKVVSHYIGWWWGGNLPRPTRTDEPTHWFPLPPLPDAETK